MLELFNINDTYSTKELAKMLNITTAKAYKMCCQLENDGFLYRYGYSTGRFSGMETTEIYTPDSKYKTHSIVWQRIK